MLLNFLDFFEVLNIYILNVVPQNTIILAQKNSYNYPLESKEAFEGFYVDDLFSGGSSVINTFELQQQLMKMLSSAGFVLRK